ncbi:MAG: hypothetical protein WBV45_07195 [Lutimonas sp.]
MEYVLKIAQPTYQLALTSSFYQSLLKKRIQMLQKSKSNNIMYLKFSIILPLLVAFVLNFNTEIVAQQKSASTEEIEENIEIDEEMEVITKDFTKSDMEKLKANLLKQGIELKYKKLKYNEANEIIGIELTVSNDKGNRAKLSQNGDEPISPISIRYDAKNGTLALGNMKGTHYVHVAVHTDHEGTMHKEIRKEIIIDQDGEKEVIIIRGDGDGHDSHKDIDVRIKTGSGDHGDNDFVFLNESDGKPLIIVDGEEVIDGKMEDLDHENIETIEVLKGTKAIEKYGEKARDGVVIITSKN